MAYDAQDTTLEGAGFDYQGRCKNARDRRRSLKKRDKKKPARAVFACPNGTTLLSPFDGRAIPCLFEPTCPAGGALPAIQYAHGATRIYNAQTAFRQARVAEAAQTYPSCGRWPCPSWGPPTFLDPHVAHAE